MTSADAGEEKFWHSENEQNKGTYQEKCNVEIFKVDESPETTKILTSQALDSGIDGGILKDVGNEKIGAPAKSKPQPRFENINPRHVATMNNRANGRDQKVEAGEITRHSHEFDENNGKRQTVHSDSEGTAIDVIRTRELHNLDVNDHAIEYRAVKRTQEETPDEDVEDKDHYQWFSARIICQWIAEKRRRHQTLYSNVDDHDGKQSYEDEEMQAPEQYKADEETRAGQYRQLRVELICLEDEDVEGNYEVTNQKQREQMNNTIEEITNLGQLH